MKHEFLKRSKKFTAVLIVFVFLSASLSPLFARKAQAQWVVATPDADAILAAIAASTAVSAGGSTAQVSKEFGLDGIAFLIAKLIIQRITASTVNWINSGFKGNPAFVTNPEAYFGDIADKVAGQAIFNNPNLNFLCGPISAKIRIALQSNYIGDNNRYRCTLTQIGQNMDNFMADFNNGGWDNFFEVTQRQQNNPIGAYMMAENEMTLQIATRQGTAQAELNQGNGFLSSKKCNAGTTVEGANYVSPTGQKTVQDSSGNYCAESNLQTVTPGSVIAAQLNKQLGAGTDSLVTADEINEIVSALLTQLVSHVVGGIGSGLRSLSSPDSTSGGQSFTSQMSNSTAAGTTDYFGNKQDTSILDIPIPVPGSSSNQNQTPIVPLDTDCSNVDIATLDSMAQQLADKTGMGMTFDEAMRILDCDPPGIH